MVRLRADLGHYRLLEKLGAGGMGEVFRAHDEHLGRDVAIKLLPPHTFLDETARKRFRKEATALSKISHPNVATIFDFDSQDDTDFLVMEYLPGVSLAEQLALGPLPEQEMVRLGTQLAEGLAAAHEQGVLHRDLKPGNVRITPDGRAKILDFGLAKLRRDADNELTESITETQAVSGTLPYMPPEQLRGQAADARSDLYSLGVVLFEMATGKLPFQEKLSTALADSILHKPCPAPGRLNPELSPRVEEIILKCLEKQPENRYQSAKDLLVDLRRSAAPVTTLVASPARQSRKWLLAGVAAVVVIAVAVVLALEWNKIRERFAGTSSPKIESIAVLPLANLSGDPGQEYFVDGMTDELITQMAKIGSLRVISRTSVMRFKNSNTPLPEIAKQLNVDAVIEGSVMRAGDRVRINAQLLGANDTHLWADTFDRDVRDVLALSSEVTRAIADRVRVVLTPREKEQLQRSRSVDKEAYDAYLQGRFFMERRAYSKATEYFEVAVQKDPNFASAWYDLAESYGMTVFRDDLPLTPRMLAAADKVMQLAPESAEAYIIRGDDEFYSHWDWSACERDFRRAAELAPRSLAALDHYSGCLSALGRVDEALRHVEIAKQVDPLSPLVWSAAGMIFDRAAQPARAIEQYLKEAELEPSSSAYLAIGRNYEALGKTAEARDAYLKGVRLAGLSSEETKTEEDLLQRQGPAEWRKRSAQSRLKKLQERARAGYVSPAALATAHAAVGQRDEAIKYLEQAFAQHLPRLAWLKTARGWDPLRSDPRFQEILRRMKYPE